MDARELEGQPTGTGRYLRSLLRAWPAESGDELVGYLVGGSGEAPVLEGADARPRWRRVGRPGTRGLLWQQRLLPRAAREDGLAVFFAPAYHCPLRLPIPRVTTVHDASFFFCPHDFGLLDGIRRRLLTAAAIHVSSAILAVSDFTRAEIARRFPAAADRVVHVAHGTDDDLPPAPPREEARLRLGLSGPLVLWVGSLFNRRWVAELLGAASLLRRRFPALTVEIVGDNRTRPAQDFQRLARDLGVDAGVRLAGFVSEADLALRYAAADVAVVLSDYEGFGLPAVEAMARGVPLVVANRPALDEVVRDAALLVDARSARDVATALAQLLSDPSQAAALAARGRVAAGRYSWAEAARRTRAILGRAARP